MSPCGLEGKPFFIALMLVKNALEVAKSGANAPGPFGAELVGGESPHAATSKTKTRRGCARNAGIGCIEWRYVDTQGKFWPFRASSWAARANARKSTT